MEYIPEKQPCDKWPHNMFCLIQGKMNRCKTLAVISQQEVNLYMIVLHGHWKCHEMTVKCLPKYIHSTEILNMHSHQSTKEYPKNRKSLDMKNVWYCNMWI